jgi:hypothetical protein
VLYKKRDTAVILSTAAVRRDTAVIMSTAAVRRGILL